MNWPRPNWALTLPFGPNRIVNTLRLGYSRPRGHRVRPQNAPLVATVSFRKGVFWRFRGLIQRYLQLNLSNRYPVLSQLGPGREMLEVNFPAKFLWSKISTFSVLKLGLPNRVCDAHRVPIE